MENSLPLLLIWLGRLVGALTLVPLIGLVTLALAPEVVVQPEEPVAWCGTSAALAIDYMPPSIHRVGEAIFKANCTQCHAMHDVVVGPALKRVTERFPAKLWEPLLNAGTERQLLRSPYFRKLYEQYGRQSHPTFPFTPAERDSLMQHLKDDTNWQALPSTSVVAR